MSELSALTLTIIRLGFLAILWLFVLTTVSVMRSDLFGTRVITRGQAAPRAPKRPKQPKAPKARKGTPNSLVVTGGALAGTSVRLGETPVTLGRAQDCTIVLDDDYASSRHARIFPRDGQWWVEDLGSTNGTYLDRNRLTSPTTVPVGVPVRVGKTVLELRA
jgi:pSer/pThr/pTyr-binding forkhead associated (FHA) protein